MMVLNKLTKKEMLYYLFETFILKFFTFFSWGGRQWDLNGTGCPHSVDGDDERLDSSNYFDMDVLEESNMDMDDKVTGNHEVEVEPDVEANATAPHVETNVEVNVTASHVDTDVEVNVTGPDVQRKFPQTGVDCTSFVSSVPAKSYERTSLCFHRLGKYIFSTSQSSLYDFGFRISIWGTCKFILKMDSGLNGEEPKSWDELYSIDLMPSELFLKFREEIQGFRVGLNLEFYNAPINECQAKLVLKPLSNERRWKFIYEPIHHDIRLVSKKIPLTKFLNLQVGIGHSFQLHATGWKWKLTTCLGGDGVSRIRNKTAIGLCPGVDLRFGWRADYVLPEFNGGVGTGEALFNMNSGKLEASLDRIETILTHRSSSDEIRDLEMEKRESGSVKSDMEE
ncbi:hypothetical protein L2E82_39479 [Cichorium intybus]|uniref:Uncharacterized protein n=1 Tax=Cichorium intybus TaxID=13427 RepID=A0ACB9AK24_CICIN|nr:hypothetical protein L2E82_39479 [Cichorium intybus]